VVEFGRGRVGVAGGALDVLQAASVFQGGHDERAPHRMCRVVAGQAKPAASSSRVDRKARDLSVAKAAIGGNLKLSGRPRSRPRASDDLLRGWPVEQQEPVKDDSDKSMDAGTRPSDIFSLIAGADRHERK